MGDLRNIIDGLLIHLIYLRKLVIANSLLDLKTTLVLLQALQGIQNQGTGKNSHIPKEQQQFRGDQNEARFTLILPIGYFLTSNNQAGPSAVWPSKLTHVDMVNITNQKLGTDLRDVQCPQSSPITLFQTSSSAIHKWNAIPRPNVTRGIK